MRRLVLAFSIVAVLATAAHADHKNRRTALVLSGVGTGVSGALIVTSFLAAPKFGDINEPLFYTGLGTSVFTPTLGHWYAGQWLTFGMAIRGGAAALGAVAIATQNETVQCTPAPASGQTCQQITGTGLGLLMLAGIAYIGGAAYDLRDTSDAVDRYNREHGVFITPTAMRGATGTPVAGLAIGGVF
jgi:hypothetical protein